MNGNWDSHLKTKSTHFPYSNDVVWEYVMVWSISPFGETEKACNYVSHLKLKQSKFVTQKSIDLCKFLFH
jgi:hypothetical protein